MRGLFLLNAYQIRTALSSVMSLMMDKKTEILNRKLNFMRLNPDQLYRHFNNYFDDSAILVSGTAKKGFGASLPYRLQASV